MAWSLVSPASRGIGFALTRELLKTTQIPVVATARHDPAGVKQALLADLPATTTDPAARLTVLPLDVTDEASIAAAAATVKTLFPAASHHLRLAFAIPGVLLRPERAPAQIDAGNCLETFRVNTVGPLLLIKHFSPFLPRKMPRDKDRDGDEGDGAGEGEGESESESDREQGLPPHATWATMSARVGSTTDNTALGGWYSYRASKAGVNSLTKTFDLYLKNRSRGAAMAIALHPGTVKTDLSRDFWRSVGEEKMFEPDEAARKLLGVVRGLGVERGRGRCWDWKGKEILP